MENLCLNMYLGEFGLPSIDLECLSWLTYSKFVDEEAKIQLNFKGNPVWSPSGFLPYVSGGPKKLASFDEYVDHLKSQVCCLRLIIPRNNQINVFQGFDSDSKLTSEDRALSLAYSHQITSSLYNYFVLTLYDDEANFQIVRKLYGERIGFPFSFYYPNKYQHVAKSVKELQFGIYTDEDDCTDAVQKSVLEARTFLNNISAKLGSKPFIFGNNPSQFDARLYSYLAILYHICLPNNVLQSHIAQCPNLVAYIKRITKKYLSKEVHSSGKKYDQFNKKNMTSTSDDTAEENAENRKIQILAGLFAFFMMAAYSVSSGLSTRNRETDYKFSKMDFGEPEDEAVLDDREDE